MQISVKASKDNTLRDQHNSPNDMKAEFNNCVITSFNKSYFEKKLRQATSSDVKSRLQLSLVPQKIQDIVYLPLISK